MPELPADSAAQLAAQLAELAREFECSLPARVGQIEAAVQLLRQGWEEAALRELSAAAHRLAGAAGTFGHSALGATALQMEALARQLESDPAARVGAAGVTFDRLLTTLRAAAERSPPVGTTLPAVLSGAKK
ncbi:MAG: Hpt domain protein [Candidatus Accumulibacter appositus]|uniref:Hpt domain protein n=1 Tax=Candidatus Accumulibacter appositus TaxID=1454003 RepID=A0A011NTM7_9PROT|nr:Hpt domain-containing protein [Accumulibacter sp.]EXI78706.1 MAG: Hpt domain protein [Candidatus Accumulibacter appositus]HRF03365.1 Hpt domain-containing protein [Accumulibacter sp.]